LEITAIIDYLPAYSAYGSAVGSIGMTFLPTGGIYISGGFASKNSHLLNGTDSEFMRCYRDKGRASHILQDFPLFLVIHDDAGLRGAVKNAEMVGNAV
jgi:glucokinase